MPTVTPRGRTAGHLSGSDRAHALPDRKGACRGGHVSKPRQAGSVNQQRDSPTRERVRGALCWQSSPLNLPRKVSLPPPL